MKYSRPRRRFLPHLLFTFVVIVVALTWHQTSDAQEIDKKKVDAGDKKKLKAKIVAPTVPPVKKQAKLLPDPVLPDPMPKAANKPAAAANEPVVGILDAATKRPAATTPTPLRRGIKKRLDEWVIPAMASNRPQLFLDVATPIIAKATPDQLVEIERYIASKGLPSFESTFVTAKIKQIEQKMGSIDEKQPLALTIFLLNGIGNRVTRFIDSVHEHELMQEPLKVPTKWQVSREVFWDAHVFKNEFRNKWQLMSFAKSMAENSKRSLERSEIATKSNLLANLGKTVGELQENERDLIEREAELRLLRFEKSHRILSGNETDFEKRLVAAMSIELDGDVLRPFLADHHQTTFNRQALNRKGLAADIKSRTDAMRERYPVLTEKAFLLRSGLHSWLRGRYGIGPMAYGLLKYREAMNSAEGMTAVYMPKKRPKPISYFLDEESSSPGYDRRHFYTWNVEYRPLVRNYGTRSRKDVDRSATDVSVGEWKSDEVFW